MGLKFTNRLIDIALVVGWCTFFAILAGAEWWTL